MWSQVLPQQWPNMLNRQDLGNQLLELISFYCTYIISFWESLSINKTAAISEWAWTPRALTSTCLHLFKPVSARHLTPANASRLFYQELVKFHRPSFHWESVEVYKSINFYWIPTEPQPLIIRIHVKWHHEWVGKWKNNTLGGKITIVEWIKD